MTARFGYLVVLVFVAVNIHSNVHGKQPHRKVLILGAGLSGIVAGKTLQDNGIDDFLILEGQDYIGGRIKKTSFSGYTVEEGANWIHFAKSKESAPIWKLKEETNLKGVFSNFVDIIMRDENGTVLTDDASWFQLGKAMKAVAAKQEEREEANKPPISVRTGLDRLGWNPKTPAQYAIEYFVVDFEHAKRAELISFDNAIDGWTDAEDYEYFSTDQRGLSFIYEDIKRSVQNHTKLNKTVTGIQYNSTLVKVLTSDGETYTADFALCTFSTGVLGSDMVKFKPPLPQWKREAILKLPMSVYTKIYLKFPKKFWDDKEYILLAAQKRGYFTVLQDLDRPGISPNGSGLLLVSVTDDEGRRIEKQSFQETKKEIMKMLRGVYGQNISEPTDIHYARWSLDPYIRGSYSDSVVGITEQTFSNLVKNLGNLYFSGEATDYEWQGYMQGSYRTGQKKAKLIAKLIKCKENGEDCQISCGFLLGAASTKYLVFAAVLTLLVHI